LKNLGSPNFKVREAATKGLKDRPDSVPALRELLRSTDAEVRNRATEILNYLESRPARDFADAIKDGRVELAIEMMAPWLKGKYESESWLAFRDLARNLAERHEKQGGGRMQRIMDRCARDQPLVLTSPKITETTQAELERSYFLRAGEVDIDRRRQPAGGALNNLFEQGTFTIATRSVRLHTTKSHIIFAGGSIDLLDGAGEGINGILIFSCGDVTLNCVLGNSLVIARGKVTCNGVVDRCRIICGGTFVSMKDPNNCLISENDANPLGFIRWSDSPKAEQKKK